MTRYSGGLLPSDRVFLPDRFEDLLRWPSEALLFFFKTIANFVNGLKLLCHFKKLLIRPGVLDHHLGFAVHREDQRLARFPEAAEECRGSSLEVSKRVDACS
jgi:hypothetical protein